MFDITVDDVLKVYEQLKDRYELVLTNTADLDEGFTVDCPILVGRAHRQIIELYLDFEMFVLDDGWFGTRNDDFQGLGDWTENKKKLPKGLKGLSEKINKIGKPQARLKRKRPNPKKKKPLLNVLYKEDNNPIKTDHFLKL